MKSKMSSTMKGLDKSIYTDEIKSTQTTTTLGGNNMTKIKSARQQLEEIAGKVAVNRQSPYGIVIGVTKHNVIVRYSTLGMFGEKIYGEDVIYQKSLGEWIEDIYLEDRYLEPENWIPGATGFSKNEIEAIRIWSGYSYRGYSGGKDALSQEERNALLDEFYKDTLTQAMFLINS